MIDFNVIPSPCYVMEEKLLRNNLALIKSCLLYTSPSPRD